MDGIPVFEVEFDKDGAVVNRRQIDAVLAGIDASHRTNLLVFSLAWNNDIRDARNFYQRLVARFADQLPAVRALTGWRFAAVEIRWPSRRFAAAELILYGIAALDDATLNDKVLEGQLDALNGVPHGSAMKSSSYCFMSGKICDLNENFAIQGQSDICKDEVAFAILTAIASSS